MEAFLKKNAGLTKRQISQAKFRPDGITRNGVRCRVTETIYPGDVIRVCLEEAGTASAHLENYNDGIKSKDLSDFHSNKASAPVSETSFSLNILYEDTDILAVDKPAGMVTHPTGMHYTDSLSNLVASYFREKNEQVCVRRGGRGERGVAGRGVRDAEPYGSVAGSAAIIGRDDAGIVPYGKKRRFPWGTSESEFPLICWHILCRHGFIVYTLPSL